MLSCRAFGGDGGEGLSSIIRYVVLFPDRATRACLPSKAILESEFAPSRAVLMMWYMYRRRVSDMGYRHRIIGVSGEFHAQLRRGAVAERVGAGQDPTLRQRGAAAGGVARMASTAAAAPRLHMLLRSAQVLLPGGKRWHCSTRVFCWTAQGTVARIWQVRSAPSSPLLPVFT